MSLLVFGLWTLFVWVTRIGNILRDDELSAAGKAAGLVVTVLFCALGALALAGWWRWRHQALTPGQTDALRWAALTGAAYWVVRLVLIAVGDHSGAFIAVHAVLAGVSIGLALWVARSGTLPRRHGSAGHRRPEAHVA